MGNRVHFLPTSCRSAKALIDPGFGNLMPIHHPGHPDHGLPEAKPPVQVLSLRPFPAARTSRPWWRPSRPGPPR